jgi:eukaryotic-like serine/threonine-protein kinase
MTSNRMNRAGTLEQLGKYRIRQILGHGASGTVYLATDTFHNIDTAVKVIERSTLSDPETGDVCREQFLNEASLTGKLNHPHIVSIFDAVVEEDGGHIAMEYVPGGNLSRYANAGGLLPIPSVIEIGFKCCGALDYAYREGIVHRDIKPENIMVMEGTDVKIADFGAAYLQRAYVRQTANVGSPYYMSPEQITDGPLTRQSDMYSLGVVLYVLLTGIRPFGAQSLDQLFQKILSEDPLPPSQIRADIPRELENIVLRTIQKAPTDRYPTWAEFALDLANVGQLSIYAQSVADPEKFTTLRSSRHLVNMTDPEIWELARAGRWKRLPAQSAVLREGDTDKNLYFLATGNVKVTKSGRLLDIVNQGEFFGEMGYIRSSVQVRQATVETFGDALVCEFDDAKLRAVSKGCQLNLMRALVETLADRLALADSRIVQPRAN